MPKKKNAKNNKKNNNVIKNNGTTVNSDNNDTKVNSNTEVNDTKINSDNNDTKTNSDTEVNNDETKINSDTEVNNDETKLNVDNPLDCIKIIYSFFNAAVKEGIYALSDAFIIFSSINNISVFVENKGNINTGIIGTKFSINNDKIYNTASTNDCAEILQIFAGKYSSSGKLSVDNTILMYTHLRTITKAINDIMLQQSSPFIQ
jgi:hypothetical protein